MKIPLSKFLYIRGVLLFVLLGIFVTASSAPIVRCIPANPTLDEPVDIIFDASEGNRELFGFVGDVYAHTGLETSEGAWKQDTDWNAIDSKQKMTPIGNNKWRLSMPQGIRKFYNITDPNLEINGFDFVFRNLDGDKQAKDTTGDIKLFFAKYVETIPASIDDLNQPVKFIFNPYYELNDGRFSKTDALYVHTWLKPASEKEYGSTWNDNSSKYTLTKEGNKYVLNLPNGIKDFYGVTANDYVNKIGFIVRNSSNQTTDLFVEINNPLIQASVPFPTETETFNLVFDLTKGNKAFTDFVGDIYIHTGVITNKSKDINDWKHGTDWKVPSTDPEKPSDGPDSAYKLTKLNNNFASISIPNPRTFYGMEDTDETIEQIVLVLRDKNGNTVGKTETNEDIYLKLYPAGKTTVKFTSPATNSVTINKGETINFRGAASTSGILALLKGDVEIKSVTDNVIEKEIQFNVAGEYSITLKTEDSETTITVNVLATTAIVPLPSGMRPGINYHEADQTKATLVLQAPYKQNVYVIGDFNDWEYSSTYQMNKDGEMFWITLNNLTPEAEYAFQYVVDGNITVADPYTDKVLDENNDKWINEKYPIYPNLKAFPAKAKGITAVLQTGQPAYNWKVTDFKRPENGNLMMYELHLRDFTEEGSYKAALEKLPYLKELGINAIELMPINEFEGNDSWGYNPSFYFAVDKAYGTKNDLREFVDKCHENGIAVILDMVLNHSFEQSPLFQLYKGSDGKPSEENPWYNKNHNFENQLFHWGVDFNHESAYTQALVDSVAAFWLSEYKVDGFRYDFTKGFTNAYKEGIDQFGWNKDQSRIDILKRMAQKVWEYSPTSYVIFEHLTATDEESELAYIEKETQYMNNQIMFWKGVDPNTRFGQVAKGYSDNSDISLIFDWQVSMNTNTVVGYMESHDEERLTYMAKEWGKGAIATDLATRMKQAAANAAFFLSIPGPKMIWQFGELGYDISIDDGGRTGRKPIKWEYYNVPERKALYDTYSKVLQLRAKRPELFSTRGNVKGDKLVMKIGNNDWVDGRSISVDAGGNDKMLLFGNFTETPIAAEKITFPADGDWYEYITDTPITVSGGKSNVNVEPHSFKLFLNFVPENDYLYISDLGTDKLKYEDVIRLKAGGWKDKKVELEKYLEKRNETIMHTTLDLTEATIPTDELSKVFEGLNSITSLILPENDYSDARKFTSSFNPNCMIYVSGETVIPNAWNNVIKSSKTATYSTVTNTAVTNLTLDDDYIFHFAKDFQVPAGKTISYTRKMEGSGKSGGWHSIALPFNATTITVAELSKNILPATQEQQGHFWLRNYKGSNMQGEVAFEPTAQIDADIPYIVAFPNNEWGNFPSEWTVTFSGQSGAEFKNNKEIKITDENGKFDFYGTFQSIEEESNPEYYTLDFETNKFQKIENQVIKPFYSYFEDVKTQTMSLRSLAMGVKDKEVRNDSINKEMTVKDVTQNGIEKAATTENEFSIYGDRGAAVIKSTYNTVVSIHRVNGFLVLSKAIKAGEYRFDLPEGIYIINGQKILIK